MRNKIIIYLLILASAFILSAQISIINSIKNHVNKPDVVMEKPLARHL